ncbi:MAG: hypothetical protein HY843_07375 [Bdellovibrio sp.]|nr:hypothetical protein [Bdellovibrio sp.]
MPIKKNVRYPPLLISYLKKYQQDPTSRVFAPLAEAYRKMGFVDDAIEIAREGLLINPSFISGKVALARAYCDKKLFSEVIQTLVPVIRDIPDNLIAQRLLADSFLMLNRVSEALNCYKTLLYFNPLDTETAKLVYELETRVYAEGTIILKTEETSLDFADDDANDDNEAGENKQVWIKKIEFLQNLLQKVERYRLRNTCNISV